MSSLPTIADPRADLDLAKAFADSKMVPDVFKKSVGDCYIAIQLARRYRMDTWSLMQEMYVIQGKAMMSGKLATAILNNSLADPLRPTYTGEGDGRTITLTGRPEGETQPLSVTLTVKDAKTNNEQWKKAPDQMLMYAASRMWGRRYTPDILLGILFDDEEVSEPMEPPQYSTKPITPIASPSPSQHVDEKTGEVFDAPVPLHRHEGETWGAWARRFVTVVRGASTSIDQVDRWLSANAELIDACKRENTTVHGNLERAITHLKTELLER